ncbi:MAG TPA: PDZ domain-containing protein [Gammaproteobacteria bacterium]|nr:PDZ domain-containing protein [Gammaproteobacteria bacterium]
MRQCAPSSSLARRTALIKYRVRLADLDRHLFEIECRIDAAATEQRFSLPAWIPGSYLLREFARFVVGIEASSAGKSLPVEKIESSTWLVRGARGELTLTTKVYALDQSVRGAYLDRRRGYFNGPCMFLLPEGRDAEPIEVTLEAPANPICEGWRVATALTRGDVNEQGFGVYTAADYDELLDHPVEVSDFESVEFEAAGVPHHLVVAGRFESDLERVASDLKQICETQIEFFGRPAPFDRYWFLCLVVGGDSWGGLEHRTSTSLIFGRDDLPKAGESGVPRDYQRFLALASHEYFHTWHVKRTKPAAFMPYRLDRRVHTRLLWAFEGITSYYQELMLLRSGVIGVAAFLQRIAEGLTRVYRSPGRFRQSLSDSSFDAWEILYKPESNHPNSSISYYTKGALVALALDLTMRRASAGKKSLDDVLRELWRRYGARGVGVPEDGVESLAAEIGGADLASFFAAAIRGTEDPPLAELLGEFGVRLELRAALGPEDKGGTPRVANGELLALGIGFRDHALGLELTTVLDGGPAQRAGLNPGDVLIAVDRLKVSERNFKRRLARFESGERITASVFRGDELIEVGLVLRSAPLDTCYLAIDEQASADAVQRRSAWLGE